MEVTQALLRRVQLDNIREHQIGGETDGISPEVAADLGFMAIEDVLQLVPVEDETNQVETPAPVPRKLTSREQNENYKRHLAQHRKLVPKQIRGR